MQQTSIYRDARKKPERNMTNKWPKVEYGGRLPTLNELPWFPRGFLRDFVPAVAFFLIVRQLIVEPYYIPSLSMYPTLITNDNVAVEKFSKFLGPPQRGDLVVFTCSFYGSVDDVRFKCCLDMLHVAKHNGVRVVVVDASPLEAVRKRMREAGAFRVEKQAAAGKKGAALREALALAAAVAGDDDACLLCWTEPEKADMGRHWAAVARDATLDVVVPARRDETFRRTYPVEQYHSESFANAYLNAAAKAAGFATALDWHFGPFCLRKAHAQLWLDGDGELWDAQLLPLVAAIGTGLKVGAVEVDFEAPWVMKAAEEGDLGFCEKRLMQINYLDPKVLEALKALDLPKDDAPADE